MLELRKPLSVFVTSWFNLFFSEPAERVYNRTMPMRLAKPRLSFFPWNRVSFEFFETGPLVDGELQLCPPSLNRVDALLAATEPMTDRDALRRQILDFLRACPDGHQKPDRFGETLPTYHFWMVVPGETLPVVGGIGLRVGNNFDTVTYFGHIGYHVYPHARGRRYAKRACQLLLPLALRHGLDPLWITCNPDNFASRRTCELLGAKLVETIPVPENHLLHQRGDREKCRYRLDLK